MLGCIYRFAVLQSYQVTTKKGERSWHKEHVHHVEKDPLENIICAVDAKTTTVRVAAVRIHVLVLHLQGEE